MKWKVGLVTALSLIAAACGGDGGVTATTVESAASTTTPAAPTTEPPAATTVVADNVVTIADSVLGRILVDGDGKTLYLFKPDAQGSSTCVEGCAGIWPPLTGTAVAEEGADGSLLGMVTRDDASEQVTYNGWPLYRYAGDTAPGDTNGQGINGVWFVVSAAGDPIT